MSKASQKRRHVPQLESLENRLNPAPQIVYDNASWVTGAGDGFAGADTSAVSPPQNVLGFNWRNDIFHVADDFTVPGPNGLYVYGFIFTGFSGPITYPGGLTSNFTEVYTTLWNGPPGAGGAVIQPPSGDLLDEAGGYTFDSGVFRVGFPVLMRNDLRIHYNYADTTPWLTSLYLPPGTYWIEFSARTNPATSQGVWMNLAEPPLPAHNARQFQVATNTWTAMQDPTAGGVSRDIPFYIYGDFPAGPTPVSGSGNLGSFAVDSLAGQGETSQVIDSSAQELPATPTSAVEQVFAETVEQPAIAPTPSAASEVFQASNFQLDFAL